MAGPVNEEFNALVKSLNESKYSKEECLHILTEYNKHIFSNCVASSDRWGASMITGDYNKRVKRNEWKFPHGFFGNWAKHHEENESFDVDEMGC